MFSSSDLARMLLQSLRKRWPGPGQIRHTATEPKSISSSKLVLESSNWQRILGINLYMCMHTHTHIIYIVWYTIVFYYTLQNIFVRSVHTFAGKQSDWFWTLQQPKSGTQLRLFGLCGWGSRLHCQAGLLSQVASNHTVDIVWHWWTWFKQVPCNIWRVFFL